MEPLPHRNLDSRGPTLTLREPVPISTSRGSLCSRALFGYQPILGETQPVWRHDSHTFHAPRHPAESRTNRYTCPGPMLHTAARWGETETGEDSLPRLRCLLRRGWYPSFQGTREKKLDAPRCSFGIQVQSARSGPQVCPACRTRSRLGHDSRPTPYACVPVLIFDFQFQVR